MSKRLLGYNVRVKAEDVDYFTFKEYVEIAKRADKCFDYGLYYLAIPEFFARRDPARLHAIPYMGAVATVTEHVKFGPHVLEVPLLHPKHLADISATLDIMSNGRFILGVGVGVYPYEYDDVFGVLWKERGKIIDECLEIMKKFWTAPRNTLVSYEGKYFKIKNEISPPCVQQPHVPIWVGGHSEAALRRTAQYGNEWTPGWWAVGLAEEEKPTILGERLDIKSIGVEKSFSWDWALGKLKEYCKKFGRELVLGRPPRGPDEVGFNMTFNFNVNPDREKAVQEVTHFWTDVRKGRTQGGGSAEMKLKYAAVGNAEEVIEKIDKAYKLGAYLTILYPLSTNSKLQWERIEKEVLPSL